jgi:hypothetical protein
MRVIRIVFGLLWVLAAASPASADQAQTYVDYQRQVLRGEREVSVRANVPLSPEEGKAFWPLYQEYHDARQELGDRSYRIIRDYADAYNNDRVTDAQAEKWVKEALNIRAEEEKLLRRHMDRVAKVLPGKKFARYYQIESKLDSLVRAKLASEIPLVE